MEPEKSRRRRKACRRPAVTSERVEETVLSTRCKEQPSNPSFACQSVKRFYG